MCTADQEKAQEAGGKGLGVGEGMSRSSAASSGRAQPGRRTGQGLLAEAGNSYRGCRARAAGSTTGNGLREMIPPHPSAPSHLLSRGCWGPQTPEISDLL